MSFLAICDPKMQLELALRGTLAPRFYLEKNMDDFKKKGTIAVNLASPPSPFVNAVARGVELNAS
jgi:hypothetical protein